MRLKQCTKCGKSFQTDNTFQAMCDECLAASKKSTLATRTCRQCGVKFTGGPRAWYCPECREARVKEQRKQCRKNGPKRPSEALTSASYAGLNTSSWARISGIASPVPKKRRGKQTGKQESRIIMKKIIIRRVPFAEGMGPSCASYAGSLFPEGAYL